MNAKAHDAQCSLKKRDIAIIFTSDHASYLNSANRHIMENIRKTCRRGWPMTLGRRPEAEPISHMSLCSLRLLILSADCTFCLAACMPNRRFGDKRAGNHVVLV